MAVVLGTAPRLPGVAVDDDFVWTFAGLGDGESIFKHQLRKDCAATQADLPKGVTVQCPQNRAKRQRRDDQGQG